MNDAAHADIKGPSSADSPEFIGRVVGKVSHALDADRIGAGRLAGIRRMAWREFPPGFWEFYFKHVPAQWRQPAGDDNDRVDLAWAALLRAMAEAAPNPHANDTAFGAALADTGYAETRFVRFLRADGEDLAREARTAAVWLAGKGRKANWREPAELILNRIGRFGSYGGIRRSDNVTNRLARDYFRAQAKKTS